jgi:DNA-binding SARP family transcriptional activator
MSTYLHTRRRVRGGNMLGVVASIGTLALLWAFRPSLAELPRSLDEPLTATSVEEVGLLLAWLALTFLVLAILVRGLRSTAHRRTGLVHVGDRFDSHPSGTKHAPARPPARDWTSRASNADSSALPDQVVLTLPVPAEAAAATTQESRVESAHEPPPISVSVLGPLQITGGKRRRRLRASAQELLAYLAFHPEGASRDQLLEALWPGEDPKRSEQRLWQSSSDVRRVVGEVIRREDDRYVLERAHVQVDLDEFERLLAQAGDADDPPRELERALSLFRGEPLAGSDYLWADGDMRRLRAMFVEVLERVGRARLASGNARGALEAAERGIAVDLLNEEFWRLAMQAEAHLGLRDTVSQRYEALCDLLDERLGLEPSRETRTLHRRLLSQA